MLSLLFVQILNSKRNEDMIRPAGKMMEVKGTLCIMVRMMISNYCLKVFILHVNCAGQLDGVNCMAIINISKCVQLLALSLHLVDCGGSSMHALSLSLSRLSTSPFWIE